MQHSTTWRSRYKWLSYSLSSLRLARAGTTAAMPTSVRYSMNCCASYPWVGDYVLTPAAGEQGLSLGNVMLLSRRQREPQRAAQSVHAHGNLFVLNPPRLRPRAGADCPP